jgi:predicted N-acetyltransferase YhbS
MTDHPNAAVPQPPLELVEESRLDAATDAAVRQLLCACYPADAGCFSRSRPWNGCVPEWSAISRAGGRVVGHVAVVVRTVSCAGRGAKIAGIQNLAVTPELRRTGLSRRLMTAAMREAERRGIRWGLLFCLPGLERFYASLGWKRLDVPVSMADALGRSAPIPAKNIAMALELAGESFPPGAIDLQGRDW